MKKDTLSSGISEMVETPVGTAQVEDPLGKVFFFTKLAETEPTESESISLMERVWSSYL